MKIHYHHYEQKQISSRTKRSEQQAAQKKAESEFKSNPDSVCRKKNDEQTQLSNPWQETTQSVCN